MILESRELEGRSSFDAARLAWAQGLSLESADGLYLGELQSGARTLEELVRALEPCGTTRQEIRAAIDRLTAAGMVDALPVTNAGR